MKVQIEKKRPETVGRQPFSRLSPDRHADTNYATCGEKKCFLRMKSDFSPQEKNFLMLNKYKNVKLKCEILYLKSHLVRYRSLRATPFKWHQYFHFVNGKPPRDNRWKEMI